MEKELIQAKEKQIKQVLQPEIADLKAVWVRKKGQPFMIFMTPGVEVVSVLVDNDGEVVLDQYTNIKNYDWLYLADTKLGRQIREILCEEGLIMKENVIEGVKKYNVKVGEGTIPIYLSPEDLPSEQEFSWYCVTHKKTIKREMLDGKIVSDMLSKILEEHRQSFPGCSSRVFIIQNIDGRVMINKELSLTVSHAAKKSL